METRLRVVSLDKVAHPENAEVAVPGDVVQVWSYQRGRGPDSAQVLVLPLERLRRLVSLRNIGELNTLMERWWVEYQ